jgi:O-antigen/teichoic acid export membrane protein
MYNKSLTKSTLIHLLGGVVAAGGSLLLGPAYLRLLSPDQYGIWSRFLLLVQVLQPIMCWGLLASITRLLVDASIEKRIKIIAAAFRLASGLNLLILLVIILVFTLSSETDPNVEGHLIFSAIAAGLGVYPAILMGIYLADNDAIGYRSVTLIGFSIQVTLLAIGSSLFSLDADYAIWLMIVGTGLYSGYTIFKIIPKQIKAQQVRAEYIALLTLGIPVLLYVYVGQAGDFFIRGLLATHVTQVDFGNFSAALLFASIIAMISSAVNLSWVPLYYRKAKEWHASGLYVMFTEIFIAGTGLLCLIFIVLSEELLTVYSGTSFELPLITVAGLLIASWLNSAVWMSLSNPLFHQKRLRLVLVLALSTSALTLPLAWLLIMKLSVLGASIGLVTSALVLCIFAAIALSRLRITGPSYSLIIILFISMILISGPWLNFLYAHDELTVRIGGKLILISSFVIIWAIFFLPKSLNVINKIEKDINT